MPTKTVTITLPERTRTVRVSPEAQAAINLARKSAAEIEATRQRLSDLAEQRADAIRAALETGLSQATIGHLLGISGQAVHNILRQH